MNSDVLIEMWKTLKSHIDSTMLNEAALDVVAMLNDHEIEIDEIREIAAHDIALQDAATELLEEEDDAYDEDEMDIDDY